MQRKTELFLKEQGYSWFVPLVKWFEVQTTLRLSVFRLLDALSLLRDGALEELLEDQDLFLIKNAPKYTVEEAAALELLLRTFSLHEIGVLKGGSDSFAKEKIAFLSQLISFGMRFLEAVRRLQQSS